jgi:biopolymer transport protein ExbB
MLTDGIGFLLKGGWIMYPLFALAVISVAVMIERFISLRRVSLDNDDLLGEVRRMLLAGNVGEAQALCERTHGPVAALLASGIRNRHLDPASIERSMEELALTETPHLYKRLGVLDTVITMAPLMGLLGTIVGMVHAFDILGTAGATGSASKMVTGGIAEALVATGAGLFIAIIAVLFLNHFNKRVRLALHQMDLLKVMVINRWYGGGSAHQGVPVRDAHAANVTAISAGRAG